jgi:hypothetical protein
VFENRVFKRIFGPKRDEVMGGFKEDEVGRACSTNGGGVHIGYWWESQKVRNHWEDQDVGGWTIKMDLRQLGWNGLD